MSAAYLKLGPDSTRKRLRKPTSEVRGESISSDQLFGAKRRKEEPALSDAAPTVILSVGKLARRAVRALNWETEIHRSALKRKGFSDW